VKVFPFNSYIPLCQIEKEASWRPLTLSYHSLPPSSPSLSSIFIDFLVNCTQLIEIENTGVPLIEMITERFFFFPDELANTHGVNNE
jgi:hypothetical protein